LVHSYNLTTIEDKLHVTGKQSLKQGQIGGKKGLAESDSLAGRGLHKKQKVNAKLSLYLTKQYAMKTYWGSGGNFHASLTVALNGDE
jgi:hypothetical protein